jgi:hypothetical protein
MKILRRVLSLLFLQLVPRGRFLNDQIVGVKIGKMSEICWQNLQIDFLRVDILENLGILQPGAWHIDE